MDDGGQRVGREVTGEGGKDGRQRLVSKEGGDQGWRRARTTEYDQQGGRRTRMEVSMGRQQKRK